jgi:hypothetical protein
LEKGNLSEQKKIWREKNQLKIEISTKGKKEKSV